MSNRTIKIPTGCRAVIVTDQLIEQMRAEAGPDGWGPVVTIQVNVPTPDGLTIDPGFRYATP